MEKAHSTNYGVMWHSHMNLVVPGCFLPEVHEVTKTLNVLLYSLTSHLSLCLCGPLSPYFYPSSCPSPHHHSPTIQHQPINVPSRRKTKASNNITSIRFPFAFPLLASFAFFLSALSRSREWDLDRGLGSLHHTKTIQTMDGRQPARRYRHCLTDWQSSFQKNCTMWMKSKRSTIYANQLPRLTYDRFKKLVNFFLSDWLTKMFVSYKSATTQWHKL